VAIVVRYFSTSAAGAGDGTTWADRALFISGGAFSTILTAFDFNSADTLECRLGPGTYTFPATLQASVFSVNAPRPDFPLVIHGCDSNGDRIVPDNEWHCAQGTFDSSAFPLLECGSSFQINLGNLCLRCVSFQGSINNTVANTIGGSWYDFVVGTNTRSAAGEVINVDVGSVVTNSYLYHTNSTHGRIVRNNGSLTNVRLKGNPSATSGERAGIGTIATGLWHNCRGPVCIIDCVGGGVLAAVGYVISNTTIYNCGTAVSQTTTTGQATNGTLKLNATRNFIANCTTGFSASGPAAFVANNRIRATTALSVPANSHTFNNETASGSDSDEFVDSANGDFRIKKTSVYWGNGYGAGDEPSSGGSRPTSPFNQTVIA
jgi:hypothetical protein